MAPPTDPDAARLVAGVLAPGETVVWAGRPDLRRVTRTDGRLIALGLFWVAVAGAGFYGFGAAFLSDAYGGLPAALRLVLLATAAAPFVAVAAYCLGGHVALRRRTRAHTAYVVTASRVLVATPSLAWFGRLRIAELALADVGRVDVAEERHGVGDVTVADRSGAHAELVLRSLRGAAEVADLVRQRTGGT